MDGDNYLEIMDHNFWVRILEKQEIKTNFLFKTIDNIQSETTMGILAFLQVVGDAIPGIIHE